MPPPRPSKQECAIKWWRTVVPRIGAPACASSLIGANEMGETHSTVHHFRIGNRPIRVETLAGRHRGPRRSVILLHGANGVRYANPVISGVMQFLGLQDFAVHLVHYFDRTNTSYADDP